MAGFAPAAVVRSSSSARSFPSLLVGVSPRRSCPDGGKINNTPACSRTPSPRERNLLLERRQRQRRGVRSSLASLAPGEPGEVGRGARPRANTSAEALEDSQEMVRRDLQTAAGKSFEEHHQAPRELALTKEKEDVRVQRDLALRMLDTQTSRVPRPSLSKSRSPASLHDVVLPTPTLPTPSSLDRKPRATKELIFRENDMSGNAFAEKSFVGYGWNTVWEEAWARGQWLLTLLMVQSSSSVVLQEYSELVRDNIVITLFLTMLVGSGGNAGNQSAIRVIRGLATGEMEVTRACVAKTMWQQTRVGLLLAAMLSAGGFLRVLLTEIDGVGDPGDYVNTALDVDVDVAPAAAAAVGEASGEAKTTATTVVSIVATVTQAGEFEHPALVGATGIALSLFAIVTISTMLGTAMPFALAASGQDPANAGTTIQVLLDIAGVIITCVVCTAVFTHVVPVVAPVVTAVVVR